MTGKRKIKKKDEEPQILWILRIFCIANPVGVLESVLRDDIRRCGAVSSSSGFYTAEHDVWHY